MIGYKNKIEVLSGLDGLGKESRDLCLVLMGYKKMISLSSFDELKKIETFVSGWIRKRQIRSFFWVSMGLNDKSDLSFGFSMGLKKEDGIFVWL